MIGPLIGACTSGINEKKIISVSLYNVYSVYQSVNFHIFIDSSPLSSFFSINNYHNKLTYHLYLNCELYIL